MNKFQRRKSDGRWQKRGHLSEVLEGSANWLQPRAVHSLMLIAWLPYSTLCSAEKTQQLEFCLDFTGERDLQDNPPSDRLTGL